MSREQTPETMRSEHELGAHTKRRLFQGIDPRFTDWTVPVALLYADEGGILILPKSLPVARTGIAYTRQHERCDTHDDTLLHDGPLALTLTR
jgi:hypothetical protein